MLEDLFSEESAQQESHYSMKRDSLISVGDVLDCNRKKSLA